MSGIDFFKRLLGGPSAPAQETARHLQAPTGMRVLMVDDSPTLLAVLGRMVEQEGYSPLRAADGDTALAMARDEQPSLIFLDIVMPGKNGFAVLRELRHDPATRDIPIVMISGNQQATEQFYVQRFGADDFIKKPFGRAEVMGCIHKLVLAGRLPARDLAIAPEAVAMPIDVIEPTPASVAGLAA
ncbi:MULTISPECIES: response regulator [Dyella]|uniref:Response regulator n=2 Tax=Dyella TaxID=231454 RepID=A0A4R0Z4X4_9GAMM|nr:MULTISPECIES: response regulator [Dyella]TBR38978.1 response regulator [Dyella terrae]TCI13430.1 response regulator [Dyella soli]